MEPFELILALIAAGYLWLIGYSILTRYHDKHNETVRNDQRILREIRKHHSETP